MILYVFYEFSQSTKVITERTRQKGEQRYCYHKILLRFTVDKKISKNLTNNEYQNYYLCLNHVDEIQNRSNQLKKFNWPQSIIKRDETDKFLCLQENFSSWTNFSIFFYLIYSIKPNCIIMDNFKIENKLLEQDLTGF